jgi:uncharacterized protein
MIDIGSGLSNAEIGLRYGLSEKQTMSLVDKLLSVNLLTLEEHGRRVGPQALSTDTDRNDGHGLHKPITGPSEAPQTRMPTLGRFEDDDNSFAGSIGNDESLEPAPQPKPDRPDGLLQSTSSPTEFIDVSRLGKNQWWRYVVSILFIVFFSGALTVIIVGIVGPKGLDKTTGDFIGLGSFENFILHNLSFVILFVAIFLVVRLEHKRSLLSLVTPNQSVDWKKIGKSFGVFWALLSCELVLNYVTAPEDLKFSFDPYGFFRFLPAVLIFTPLQTATEELLFRGYLLQMTALLTRNRVVLVSVSGLLFMAPHLTNPETAAGFFTMSVYYFSVGGFLTFVTLKSNSLETAIGIHAAQNMFAFLIANYANSALKTESVFFCSKLDPVAGLVSFCVMAVIFCLVMFGANATPKITRFLQRRY